jgi:hypothetical protein
MLGILTEEIYYRVLVYRYQRAYITKAVYTQIIQFLPQELVKQKGTVEVLSI